MFTVTNVRKPRSTAPNSALCKYIGDESAAPARRADLEVQAAAALEHRKTAERADNERAAAAITDFWANPKSARIALRVLLGEARRRDLQRAAGDDHARARLRSGWDKLAVQLDQCLKRNFALGAGATPAIDIISVLGVWFPDTPSPAYGRRAEAILALYFKYLEGADIRRDVLAFDGLHRAETGRLPRQQQQHDLAKCGAAAAAVDPEEVADVAARMRRLTVHAIAEPSFEQTPFVAQSRELRQLVTLRTLQLQPAGTRFVPAEASAAAAVAPAALATAANSVLKLQRDAQQLFCASATCAAPAATRHHRDPNAAVLEDAPQPAAAAAVAAAVVVVTPKNAVTAAAKPAKSASASQVAAPLCGPSAVVAAAAAVAVAAPIAGAGVAGSASAASAVAGVAISGGGGKSHRARRRNRRHQKGVLVAA